MRASDLKKLVGKVGLFDLVNGERVVTRVEKVTDDGYVTLKQLIQFQAVQVPNNPTEVQMIPVPYGAPVYQLGKNIEVDASHILFSFDLPPGMEDTYNKITGSIVLPNASNLILP